MGGTCALEECFITHGPWGGSSGEEWVYKPENFIKRITVRHGRVIDSVEFEAYLSGESKISFFGGKGGNQTDTICIDNAADEYLVSVSGMTGSYKGTNAVKSICFVTNQKRYGPYGTDNGTAFAYDGKGGVIVGFHGRDDKYLTAIGVYVLPKSLALGRPISVYEDEFMLESSSSLARMGMLNPWAADGGKSNGAGAAEDGDANEQRLVCAEPPTSVQRLEAIEAEQQRSRSEQERQGRVIDETHAWIVAIAQHFQVPPPNMPGPSKPRDP